MTVIDVGFLGYGTRALDALMADERYRVKYFFAPRPRLCEDVFNAAKKYGDKIELEIIDNKKMLAQRFSQISDVRLFVMNACPFILNREILSYMDVYNIHPGDFAANRGHHPHLWTVLLGEKSTSVILHKVGEQIDLGEVIAEEKIKLTGRENSLEVLNLAEDKIPCLLDGLYDCLTGKRGTLYTATEGIYRPFMTYTDYEITPDDTLDSIDRKIRARFMHSGAFFTMESRRVYVTRLISDKPYCGEAMLIVEKNRVLYGNGGRLLTFALGKITDMDGRLLMEGDAGEVNKC